MNNNVRNGDYLTFSQASELLPTRPSRSTLWRWARRGIRTGAGNVVKLKTARFGQYTCTTRDWLREFSEQLAEQDDQEYHERERKPATPSTDNNAKRSIPRKRLTDETRRRLDADDKLNELGI